MTAEAPRLQAGELTAEHFEFLLSDTWTTGTGVIAALRDHLVEGLSPKEAYRKHRVAPSQFYKRFITIQDRHAFAYAARRFYQ